MARRYWHAATLHSTVQRVDVVDLSRHVLDQADYFRDANGDVLHRPRVRVFVNDGRHHPNTAQQSCIESHDDPQIVIDVKLRRDGTHGFFVI